MKHLILHLFLLGAIMTLSACAGHETLKSPCPPLSFFAGSPCGETPPTGAGF